MFGNKDTGMHTGRPWASGRTATGPELCAHCGLPESAPVHRRKPDSVDWATWIYAQGGHPFESQAMADDRDEAERDAKAAYDQSMREAGY